MIHAVKALRSTFGTAADCALFTLIVCAAAGCRSASTQPDLGRHDRPTDPSLVSAQDVDRDPRGPDSAVIRVSHAESDGKEGPVEAASGDPFAGAAELSLDQLIAEVQQRNPSIQASLAAWSAAGQRYPQAIAFDDPMFRSMLAPASLASSSNVQPSYALEIDQKLFWPGKRNLRGAMAQAEANAASFDLQEVQLRLAEAARLAYFDYYLVDRNLELNGADETAVREFRKTAKARYEASQVTQQDVLQADVELGKLESRRVDLDRNRRVARARINTLLHRAPDGPLPPPPRRLTVDQEPLSAELLRERALQRPELSAQAARIQAEQAAIELACKEFYPDVEVVGRYDQFWTDHEQRAQLGINVNLPVNQSRRRAAVDEAVCNLRKLQAEYDQQLDNVRHDVEVALARLEAGRRNVRLYANQILPAARASLASAESGYTAGAVDFLRLIQAQRELIELEEKDQEAVAEFHRHRAELERAVGQPLAP
jgi:outer membrane protein, heavy metal efflux system